MLEAFSHVGLVLFWFGQFEKFKTLFDPGTSFKCSTSYFWTVDEIKSQQCGKKLEQPEPIFKAYLLPFLLFYFLLFMFLSFSCKIFQNLFDKFQNKYLAQNEVLTCLDTLYGTRKKPNGREVLWPLFFIIQRIFLSMMGFQRSFYCKYTFMILQLNLQI